MRTKVAINGVGRIGRAILKLLVDEPGIELVAVNDLVEAENLAYLLRFDTVYGRYAKPVVVIDGHLAVGGRKLQTLRERDPAKLPWRELDVDVVFECTGVLKKREDLEKHVRAGAKFVLLSAPSQGTEVETVVHGANVPEGAPTIVSCASCTTNCITPLVDGPSKSFRRGRAGAANLVPATTGAALATTRALPEHAGRFDGIAIRAPIPVGSIADLTFVTSRPTSVEEVNGILTAEAATERYAGVLGVSHDPLVSADIIGDSRASIVDLELTKVIDGDLLKIMSWYDNEWGYANQMVRQAVSMTANR